MVFLWTCFIFGMWNSPATPARWVPSCMCLHQPVCSYLFLLHLSEPSTYCTTRTVPPVLAPGSTSCTCSVLRALRPDWTEYRIYQHQHHVYLVRAPDSHAFTSSHPRYYHQDFQQVLLNTPAYYVYNNSGCSWNRYPRLLFKQVRSSASNCTEDQARTPRHPRL